MLAAVSILKALVSFKWFSTTRQQHVFSGAVMAIHHASSGELIDIRPLKDRLKTTISNALFKSNHLEVSRMVLLAGKDVPPHQVAGEVTIQCLEGSVELAVAGITRSICAGDLVCLAGRETYALRAIEDSSILVTMLLNGGLAACGT
jgi:quercetin dioxygenase-like cupin family protein